MAASTDPPEFEVQGEALLQSDRFWLDTVRDAAKESVKSLEEAAKQLITLTSWSQGIYFAAISFSEMKKALGQFAPTRQWVIVLMLVIPLLFWMISLVFAIRVFKPKTYDTNLDSPDLARNTYRTIIAYKHQQLRRAHQALALGFVPLLINVILYLRFMPLEVATRK